MRGIDSGKDALEIAPYYVFERKHAPASDVVLLAKGVVVLGAKLNVVTAERGDMTARHDKLLTYVGHLHLVIQMAAEAMNDSDEAGAFLILKTALRGIDEVLDETRLQGLSVQEEPKVPPETPAND